jgi:hypothetical protein
MNGGREERLQGLAGQLEIVPQLNKFNEQWLDDALGALFLFPFFQQFDGRSQFSGHRLEHDEETVKARRHILLHLVIQLFIQEHLLHVRDQHFHIIDHVKDQLGLFVEKEGRRLLDVAHHADLLL